jgi:hypothetical protein
MLSFIFLRINDATKDERTYQREKSARDEARKDALLATHNQAVA